jgi:hypothetical protein
METERNCQMVTERNCQLHFPNTKNKSKKLSKLFSQSETNLGSQNSLMFPAVDNPPPRNEGFLFFADGNDHEAYPYEENLLLAHGNDNKPYSFMDQQSSAEILLQIRDKKRNIQEMEQDGAPGYWMYFESGASRTVIQAESSLRQHLSNVTPTKESCTIGNGTKLPYVEVGTLTANNPATVVIGLEFDLYSAVAATKRGISFRSYRL